MIGAIFSFPEKIPAKGYEVVSVQYMMKEDWEGL